VWIETARPVETEEENLIEDRSARQDGLETTLTEQAMPGKLNSEETAWLIAALLRRFP
jgi:hypothetical protein